jgi:hypothetical protein
MWHVITTSLIFGGTIMLLIGIISGVMTVTHYLFNNGDDETLI